MNNKIEKGCLAIVVDSSRPENLGKVVTVGEFLGRVSPVEGDDQWAVDVRQLCNNGTTAVFFQREKNLMRIDNYDEDMYSLEQIEQLEKEEVK
jgi:hypothetical protein